MLEDYSFNKRKPKLYIKKDYQKKEFVNPYFNDGAKPVKRGFNTKFYLKILVVVLIFYVLIYSDLFKITQIDISGTEMIRPEELRQTVEEGIGSWYWFLLPQKNFLLTSKGRLEKKIQEKYSLNKIEIRKGWKSLKINVEEKISYLIVYNQENFYFTDSGGGVTRQIAKEEVGPFLTRFPVLNVGRKEVNIGDQTISASNVDFVLRLNEAIQKVNIKTNGYELGGPSGGEEEMTMVAKAGWRAYFDVKSDIKAALDNLQLVLNEKVKGAKIQYIDLRFGNKVYYK